MRNYLDQKNILVVAGQNRNLIRSGLDGKPGKQMEKSVIEFGKFWSFPLRRLYCSLCSVVGRGKLATDHKPGEG